MKSQLELACCCNLLRFQQLLDKYYAVLPLLELRPETKSIVSEDILALRKLQRRRSLLSDDPDFQQAAKPKGPEYSMKLVKQLISDLVALADQGQLKMTLTHPNFPPLLKVAIVTKRVRNPLLHTRKDAQYTHPLQSYDPDTLLPRAIREKKTMKTIRILNQKAINSLIYQLFYSVDECVDIDSDEHSAAEADSILSPERLGWVGAGRDKSSLQPMPDLLGLEKGLQHVLSLPLSDIARIPEVAHTGSKCVVITTHEELLHSLYERARSVLEMSLYAPLAVLAIFRQYEYLAQENQAEVLSTLINSHIDDYVGLGVEMRTIRTDLRTITIKFPDSLSFGIIELDLHTAKSDMLHNGEHLLRELLRELEQEYCGLLNHSSHLFELLQQDLRRVPSTVEELKELTEYLDSQQDLRQFSVVTATMAKAEKIHGILSEFQHSLHPTQMLRSWQTKVWASELAKFRSRMAAKMAKVKPVFVEQVIADSKRLQEVMKANEGEMRKFLAYEDINRADEYAALATEVLGTLHRAASDTSVLNSREKVLLLPLTALGDFPSLISSFQRHSQLWTYACSWTSAWSEWHYKSFRTISAEAVESKFREGLRLMATLESEFKQLPAPLSVVRTVQKQLGEFERYVRIIVQLRHPSIRDRHWESVLKELSLSVKAETATLDDLVRGEVLKHKEATDAIAHKALNEHAVESVIETAETQLNKFSLQLKKDSLFPELIYLEGLTEAENIIQELLATLKFLSHSSKYTSQFKPRLDKATAALVASLQVLRDLSEMQENWLQIYPLLQFRDVATAIGRDSDVVDDLQVFYTRQLTLICTMQTLMATSDLRIKSFVEANEYLEALWKKVKKVLSGMCDGFPRMQLLAHRELALFLTGLARKETVHLELFFPGISALQFPQAAIDSVYHQHCKVTVDSVAIADRSGPLAPDKWLGALDSALKKAFLRETVAALAHAEEDSQNWWRRDYDPQVVIVAQHIRFSGQVLKQGKAGLERVIPALSRDLRALLAALTGEIKPMHGTPGQTNFVLFNKSGTIETKITLRHKLEKLAIQVIHQLHVLEKAQESKQYRLDQFLWRALFTLEPRTAGKSLSLVVTHFDLSREFGCEWLPLPLPLFVSTPITERCLLNLTAALKNGSSALLMGASGSSKSETLKELSLLHGRHMFCWTVARGTHPTLILQALVGCLGCGSWMCLEEMQLLDAFVLNSLAFYLGKVREGGHTVRVEDVAVRAQPSFAFWGMSTQTDISLPARIQQHFRCVTMVQPDLAAVAEVRLYAVGLRQPALLAKKIARALTSLADDCQAITQSPESPLRYAATVQVVNRIVSRIVAILDAFPVNDEKYLVNNAIRRVLGTTLPRNEEVLFDEFLATLFRSQHNNIIAGTAVQKEMDKMTEIMDALNVETSASLVRTLRYTWVSISESGHNLLILTGPPGAGKSTVIRIIAQAYTSLSSTPFSVPVLSGLVSAGQVHRLIQSCVSQSAGRAYHCLDDFRQVKLSPNDWIVLDTAGFNPEALLSIARNDVYLQKELRVEVPEKLKLLVETDSLANATPALLSSCAVVHCSEGGIDEGQVFLRVLQAALPFPISHLVDLFDSHFKSLHKAAVAGQPVLQLPIRLAVLMISKWLIMLLQPAKPPKQRLTHLLLETTDRVPQVQSALLEGAQRKDLEIAWVLSLISGLGPLLQDPTSFYSAVAEMCRDEPANFAAALANFLRDNQSLGLSEVCFDFGLKRWTDWTHVTIQMPNSLFPALTPSPLTLSVPTNSTVRVQAWLELTTAHHWDVVLMGPHQSGKSLLLHQALRRRLETSFASLIPLNVLLGTSCETLQYFVTARMEETQPHSFGALGGRHHFVFLEDMNLDTHNIYDLLRFAKENGGWYYKDKFEELADLTLCLAHSYVLDRHRPLDARALRHFVILYKDRYSEREVESIFKAVAPREPQVERLLQLYISAKTSQTTSERTWQHTTLSNYMQAVKMLEVVGHWPVALQRYFLDQRIGEDSSDFYVPELVLTGSQSHRFTVFNESHFPTLMRAFHRMIEECESKHADSMKAVHRVILSPGERLGKQLYVFCAIVGDLVCGQHCIVSTLRELKTVRAVTLMAAELVGHSLVDIRLFDVSSTIANSLAAAELGYIPTDAKFDMRNIIDRAVEGKKSVCLVTIDDESDLESPVFHSFMDLLSDILLGKDVKLIGTTRKPGLQGLYPDQAAQVQRELMQRNITFCLLVQTGNLEFTRVGGRKGPLEVLKHNYRAVFNLCRITAFDELQLPPLLLRLALTVGHREDGSLDLMRRMAERLPVSIDDFTAERIAYIADVMQRSEKQRLTIDIEQLRAAARWCAEIILEGEKFGYVSELQSRADDMRKRLQQYRKVNKDVKSNVVEAAVMLEKRTFLEKFDKCKEKVRKAIAEVRKERTQPVPDSPAQYILLAALHHMVYRDLPPFPFDQPSLFSDYFSSFKWKDVQQRLSTLDLVRLPNLSAFLSRISASDYPLYVCVAAVEELRRMNEELVVGRATWMQQCMGNISGDLNSPSQFFPEARELQLELAVLDEELQQAMALRPKIQRLSSDVKALKPEWDSAADRLSAALSHSRGNSLLSATIFVLGLNLAAAPRNDIRTGVQEFLRSEGVMFDSDGKDLFLSEGVAACMWVWRLTLPYPLFIDPYGMAQDLVPDKGKVVYSPGSEQRFEEVLLRSMAEGAALVIVEPTEAMWPHLLPLVKWRYDRSVEAARGEAVKSTPVIYRNRQLEVHSNFRLYLSVVDSPSGSLSHLCTVISLEPQDISSWRTSVFLQLSEDLTPTRVAIASRSPKEELLTLLAVAPPGPIYSIPTLSAIIKTAMRLDTYEGERQKPSDEVEDPAKLVYVELLPVAMELNDLLQSLKLGAWRVSPQMFRRLMIQACEEQFQDSGVPTKEQIVHVTEPIWYRFFVRLLWGLPKKHQNAVLLSYCVSKKFTKDELPTIRELIQRGLSLPFTPQEKELAQRLKELISLLPTFPEVFTERSVEFRHFANRDMYCEKEMEGIDTRIQILLVTWLRQDLLPQFLETLVVDALGKRFSYLPEVDFSLAPQLSPNSLPIAVLFKDNDPLPGLEVAATECGTCIVHIMPLATPRESSHRSESKLRNTLKSLAAASHDKRWAVLEAYESLELAEVEALYKGLADIMRTETVHPDFRVWVLFNRSPKALPQWQWFIQHSFRIVFAAPQTVRERCLLTQAQMSQKFYESMAGKIRQLYLEHGQTAMKFRKQVKRMTRINPVLRASFTKLLLKPDIVESVTSPRANRRTQTVVKDPQPAESNPACSISDFLRYNLTLVVAIIDLRQRFARDIVMRLSWKEIQMSIQDAVAAFADLPEARLKETVLDVMSLFTHLVGPAWSEFSWYAVLNIMKHCLLGESAVLHFTLRDDSGDSTEIEYPLYHLTGSKTVERLMLDMPKRDHLQVVGLPHVLYREKQHKAAQKLGHALGISEAPVPSDILSRLKAHISHLESVIALYSPTRPQIDFETAYENVVLSRMKRYSYYFILDKYHASDFNSKVLTSRPDLSSLLRTLQVVNETRFDDFLREVESSLYRTFEYVDYRKGRLSDSGILTALSKDRTPESWLRAGPYSLRNEHSPDVFISRLTRPVTDYHGVISLNQVLDPPGLLTALLRCFAFTMQQDVELLQFEVAEHSGDLPPHSVLLTDLYLFNASFRGELLRDSHSAQPLPLGVWRCTATLEKRDLQDLQPAGAVLYYRPVNKDVTLSEIQREESLASVAQAAFHYARSETKECNPAAAKLNKVLCPLFEPRASSSIWIVFQSERPQSHWSKRGVKVDLL